MKKEDVKKQWDDSAEAWADFVRTRKDWTREYVNNPAMFRMLGDIRGKRVLDLGCGEGYNTRLMARKGAKATGVDFSSEMIRLAKTEEERKRLGIKYHVADAANLHMFKRGSFDIVASFMALQDIEDYEGAILEVARILNKGGRFVFGIPHPCFEARIIAGKRVGGWIFEDDTGKPTPPSGFSANAHRKPLYYSIDHYFNREPDILEWNMKRLTKHFRTVSFHRTLGDYIIALGAAGLFISRLDEPKPLKKGLEQHHVYFKGDLRIPHSIIVEAMMH